MSDPSVFIVDDATSSTTTTPAPGYWQRRCDRCGRAWGPSHCSDSSCNSAEFTDAYRPPTPFMTGLAARVLPRSKAKPRANATQSAELRGFLATVEHFRSELARIDEMTRAAVADGVDELQPAHNVLHVATYTSGDASMANVHTLSLGLRALAGFLAGAIETLQETP